MDSFLRLVGFWVKKPQDLTQHTRTTKTSAIDVSSFVLL